MMSESLLFSITAWGEPGGKLVTCRRDSEQTLSRDKFTWVERVES